ncbi:MAG: hypothetical protein ACR2KM_08780 [Gemmatimonadaceae bacterium]
MTVDGVEWTKQRDGWYTSECGDVWYSETRRCWCWQGLGRNERRGFATAHEAVVYGAVALRKYGRSAAEILICPRCNKRTYRDDVHTCAPPARLAEYERQIEALRESVKGCGRYVEQPYYIPYDCGERSESAISLCGECQIHRDTSILNLIGVNNG